MASMLEAVLGFESVANVIPSDVMDQARDICKSGLLTMERRNVTPEIPCDLPDIVWGKFYQEKVDRLTALFYRLTVDQAQADKGFLLLCESFNKDKFKLLVFDSTGYKIIEVKCDCSL